MRCLKKVSMFLLLSLVLTAVSLVMNPSTTKAGYADNYNRLYYDLSRVVYDAKSNNAAVLQHDINSKHGANKFKVISTVDVDGSPFHPMSVSPGGASQRLDATGFKAMAVVAEGSKKLFIAFSGTDLGYGTPADANTARVTLSSKAPGQNYQSQLFINYIHEAFPQYKSYNWYFTGHSLGGWLSTKSYLDIRSANWLSPTKSKFKHGGPINKSISGVYTFNPLPIRKMQISSTQWNANKNGAYNSDVKNLYIENEWLNAVYQMNRSELDYIGSKGAITNENVLHYSKLRYLPKGPLLDTVDYLRQAATAQKDIISAHRIGRIKPYVQ